MPKRTPKPATPYAKADAELQANCRKVYPRYDADLAAYGRPVADYNAGFVAGAIDARKKLAAKLALLAK